MLKENNDLGSLRCSNTVSESLATGASGAKSQRKEVNFYMNAKLLESTIEALKSVRSELQNNVENSVLETLDKAISDLEIIQQNSEKFSAQDLLNILSSVLDKLPVIVELIHIFTSLNK